MENLHLHMGEHVVKQLRKHPLILVGSLIPYAVLDYLPYLLPKIGEFLMSTNPTSAINYAVALSFQNPWITFIVGIYWLFVWMGAFGVFTDYFLDKWIITNERIIDINQESFWRRQENSLFLNRVQNVQADTEGFFATIFGFGNLSVESAGAEVNRIHINGLGNPEHIRDVLMKQMRELEEKRLSKA